MPSVANTPTSGPDHLTDGVSNLTLDNIRYPIGSKVTAKLSRGGTIMKGEVVAYDPAYKVVIISMSHLTWMIWRKNFSHGIIVQLQKAQELDLDAIMWLCWTLLIAQKWKLTKRAKMLL